MTKEVAEKIVRGITDKIKCNTADIDDWAEFWGFTKEEYEEFLDMAIKALEQQPCEDCISRQRVLNDLENVTKESEHPRQVFVFVDECVDYIMSVPSVTPSYNSVKTELKSSEDCISREEAINELKLAYFNKNLQSAKDDACIVDAMTDWAIRTIKRLPSVTPKTVTDFADKCQECGKILNDKLQTRWIPVKWHEITDEERVIEEYPNEWLVLIDCQMPDDGERILVQTKWGDIELDECYIDDGISLDSGRDWIDDIVAWMPLPSSYHGE